MEYRIRFQWNRSTVTITNDDFIVVNNRNVYVLGDPTHQNESLASNQLYYIGIRVTNQNNQGQNTKPFTNRISNSNGIFTVPEAVINFAAAQEGTSIALTWSNVSRSDNGSTFYKLEVSTDNGNTYTSLSNNFTPDDGDVGFNAYEYSPISYNTSYTFRVTAKNTNSNNNVTTASTPVTATVTTGSQTTRLLLLQSLAVQVLILAQQHMMNILK